MKNITAENVSFKYFYGNDKNEDLSLFKSDYFLRAGVLLDIVDLLMSSNFSRLSLFSSILSPKIMMPYALVWQSEKIDLMSLDERVLNDDFNDCDFKNSIRCYPHRTTCFSCGSIYLTLNVDPADPYPGNKGLLEEKMKNIHFYSCPNCNASLRQLVIKIIREID